MINLIPETFDEQLWSRMVEQLVAEKASILIVPDTSMYLPHQAAWQQYARRLQTVVMPPRLLTLLDWAKRFGSPDWDAQQLSRVLTWAQQLQNTPQLARWLGAVENEPQDVGSVLSAAQRLVALSDELTLHLLPQFGVDAIVEGSASLSEVVSQTYQNHAGSWAADELNVLLECWRLDAVMTPPVMQFLNVLSEMAVDERAPQSLYVLRNRPWSAYEQWFYEYYAQHHDVHVFDVATVRSRAISDGVAECAQRAWDDAQERILPKPNETAQKHQVEHGVLWSAPHPEDEAWAVVQQVLRWREEGLRRIAIVALDRAVSRRVWSQLLHCGVAVRDDTGWLLSTSRLATSWHDGLAVWIQDEPADELLSWLAHPAVYAHEAQTKSLLWRYLKDVALRQDVVLKGWHNWQQAVRRCPPSKFLSDEADAQGYDLQALALDFLAKALAAKKQLSRSRPLNAWADVLIEWAKDFGLWQGWQTEVAGDSGAVWLQMLQLWRVDETAVLLDLAAVMRVMNSEVERATFRAHDASDEVLLLPLGSTRMREFDAVWVLGADETHLHAPSESAGLLNTPVRTKLGLPNIVANQEQVRRDFMDLLVSTPRVYGSFCETTNGQPNAPSSWWRQWLRASGQSVQRLQLDWRECAAQTAAVSVADIRHCLPDTVSASDLNQLSACPYQYYVQRGLGIRERALPTEDVSPAMIGNLWHAVLARFHEQRGEVDDEQVLVQVIDEHLGSLCAANPRYWVVRENFLSWTHTYVAWWHNREQQGWRVSASELAISVAHDAFDETLGQTGLSLKWKGKLDQLDTREQFDDLTGTRALQAAVIDYKANDAAAVREKFLKPIKRGDDIQLAFYIHLLHGHTQHTVVQAGYVGVSKLAVNESQKPHEGSNTYPQAWLNQDEAGDAAAIEQAAAQLHQQVGETFTRMLKGEPLVAMGELRACAYCAVRGVCRKGYTKSAVS